MALKVLFVGGTGQISLPAVQQSVEAGHKVTVFNRGKRDVALPKGVEVITGDMSDPQSYGALKKLSFDVVCQFMVFTPEQMQTDIATFPGAGHYIFISTASAYQKPAHHYVITEKTPLENPYWEYSRRKIACERLLRESSLAWTIVRPSHTVRTGLPTAIGEGDTLAHRMLRGKPVIVPGDGTSIWTLTRSEDICRPFIKLFGNRKSINEDYHITGDKAFTWDQIYTAIAGHLGVKAEIVHVPTDTLIRYKPDWAGGLIGDRSWSALFDNSKIKSLVGAFSCVEDISEIVRESVAHVKTRIGGKPVTNPDFDPLMDRIVTEQGALGR